MRGPPCHRGAAGASQIPRGFLREGSDVDIANWCNQLWHALSLSLSLYLSLSLFLSLPLSDSVCLSVTLVLLIQAVHAIL